jgi:hypothetical protein
MRVLQLKLTQFQGTPNFTTNSIITRNGFEVVIGKAQDLGGHHRHRPGLTVYGRDLPVKVALDVAIVATSE